MRGSILVVEDDVETAEMIESALRASGFDVRVAHDGASGLAALAARSADLVLADVELGGMSGLEVCAEVQRTHPETLSIIMTGHGEIDTVASAMRAGALDFLCKPVRDDALAAAVGRAFEQLELTRALAAVRAHAVRDDHDAGPVLGGTSAAIRATIEMIARVADSDATVLISGESGTGKELVARALHAQSPRAHEPFVAINCGAMPAGLLESELFGHVRGAFTDAQADRAGLFVQAGRGTVFLDEVGELPLEMQAKLLRVLQERAVRPVGGDVERPVHARVVAATHRDLRVEVEQRRFREDLYYRIAVVPIGVPPLRARGADVLPLAHQFLHRFARRHRKRVERISLPAARRLVAYDWPGNVRELENCIERAVALCRLDEITIDDLPAPLFAVPATLPGAELEDYMTIDAMGRRYARLALAAVGGNKSRAARVLGIDRRSLYRRLEEGPEGEPSE